MCQDVVVETLVKSLRAQEVCRCGVGGNGAASMSVESRSVVSGGMKRTFTDIIVGGNDIMLDNGGSQCQVRVGGAAMWIVIGD